MKSGIKINRQVGFVELELFGWLLVIVWGGRGNCYGGKNVLRIGKTCFGGSGIEIKCKGLLTTIYFHGRKHLPTWNSEHLARWCGEYRDAGNPEYWQYTGWLGHHLYI